MFVTGKEFFTACVDSLQDSLPSQKREQSRIVKKEYFPK